MKNKNHASGGVLRLRDGGKPSEAWPLPSAAVVPPGSRADRPGRVKREERALDPPRPARFPGWRDDGDGMGQTGSPYALGRHS